MHYFSTRKLIRICPSLKHYPLTHKQTKKKITFFFECISSLFKAIIFFCIGYIYVCALIAECK